VLSFLIEGEINCFKENNEGPFCSMGFYLMSGSGLKNEPIKYLIAGCGSVPLG
jgi:hypothetical protein